ncbi:MAG: glycosyltransferase family 4 protein [Vicinamibacteria bacterium]
MKPALALVVQRYGAHVTGGSESLARALALRLSGEYAVTVFTTCARDYVTWRNELPAGESVEDGVTVRRFPVEEERDLGAFNRFAEAIYDRPHSDEDERRFLREQGPYAPALVEALSREQERFRAVLFFTYLYHPTVEGLRVAGSRSILVPTTHDEPPLRFRLYADAFGRARAFAFLTPAEEALVRSRFDVGSRPAVLAGMGIDDAGEADVAAFRARHGLARPYVLYAGRVDAGKGCADLVRFYGLYRARSAEPFDLVMIGTLAMDEPRGPGARYLGFVSEDDKRAAFAGASVVACPSAYESFSIALLDGFAHGVPGLVNARSAVLKEHCLRGQGGLFYEDGVEFVEALLTLAGDDRLRAALGASGRAYVTAEYRWDVVLERYRRLIASV